MNLPGYRKAWALTATELGLPTSAGDEGSDGTLTTEGVVGVNVVYFGPPGVGKSYAVRQATHGHRLHRTVFHPEYAHGDFVGTYRPVVGRDPDEKVRSADGEEVERPVNYFAFVPGPMVDAIVDAYSNPDQPASLIIEEINRGDCASIFGPFFQLLDRDSSGHSEYGVNVDPALGACLREYKVPIEEGLRLPPNLSLYATMNTSDQALFPMDAAFKRRWAWRSVPLLSGASDLADVHIPYDEGSIAWVAFVKALNEAVFAATDNEDRQVGPWYVRFLTGSSGRRIGVVPSDLRDKLLFYLWHDVFRNDRTPFFAPGLRSFDALQEQYDTGGLRGVLNKDVRTRLDPLTEAPLADAEEGGETTMGEEA